MQPEALLDTNVLLRHVLGDHREHSPRATAAIVAIERGERVVRLADTVVFETVFTLEKTYDVSRDAISDVLQPILALRGVVLPGKRLYPGVFELWTEEPGLSFADSYHLCLAKRLNIPAIMSFDRKLDRLPGVERIEP
jgi:predicted nucleic acid-binding protein